MKDLFGMDLLSKGIFPVLIVARNNSIDSNFYLRKEMAGLKIANSQSQQEMSDASSLKQKSSMVGPVVGGVSLIGPILAIPVVFTIIGTCENDRQAINRNLIDKELQAKTLSPGQSQYGFLYFRLTEDNNIEDIVAVQLKISDLKKQETLLFTFPIN